MVDRPSNAFTMLKNDEVEKNIYEQVMNKEFAHLDDRILNLGRVDKMLQMFQESASRSSDKLLNQPNSQPSPTSKVPSGSITKENDAFSVDDLEEEQNDVSSDEDSMRKIGQA